MNSVNTIRVTFSKQGRAKYISHLDLMRTMTRVLRRAGIPLWYTEGFSKHPYITFASPLSLGYEGLAETMDFRLENDMPMEEIKERLNRSMPDGIVVSSCAPAERKAGEIASSRWCLRMSSERQQAFEELFLKDEIPVQKRTKKKTLKTIDIKPYIQDVVWETDESGVLLRLALPTGEQAVNPALVITAACGDNVTDISVCREAVFTADGKNFK